VAVYSRCCAPLACSGRLLQAHSETTRTSLRRSSHARSELVVGDLGALLPNALWKEGQEGSECKRGGCRECAKAAKQRQQRSHAPAVRHSYVRAFPVAHCCCCVSLTRAAVDPVTEGGSCELCRYYCRCVDADVVLLCWLLVIYFDEYSTRVVNHHNQILNQATAKGIEANTNQLADQPRSRRPEPIPCGTQSLQNTS